MEDLNKTMEHLQKQIMNHIQKEIQLRDDIYDYLFLLCEENGGSIALNHPTSNKNKYITSLYIDAEDNELWVSINDSEDFYLAECSEDIFPLFGTIRQMVESGEIK